MGQGALLIAGLSAISVASGAAMSYWAMSRPDDDRARLREAVQTIAGVLIIAGFALLGFGLECALGRP